MYKIQSSRWMRKFKDKCAYKHTGKLADETKHSATIAIHIPSNDERQVQILKIQSEDKTQYRVRLHHVANKYVLEGEIGTYTWSHPDWISKSTKPKRSDIREKIYRMDFEHGRKARKAAYILHKNVYTVPVSYSENRNRFFTPSPADSFFFTLSNFIERERIQWTRELPSFHMMSYSDSTPKEQETIQNSKDPSVIVTANGTIHTTEEATVYVCDLDMLVQVFFFWKNHLRYSRWVTCAKITDIRRNGIQVSHQISSKIEHIECNTDNLVVPRVQATEHQTEALDDRKQTRPWATTSDVWKQNYQNGVNHSWKIDERIFKFDRRLPPADVRPFPINTSFRASSSKTLFETRIAKNADARKLRECHAEEILTIGRTELRSPSNWEIRSRQTKVLNEDQESRLHRIIQWLCKIWRRNGFPFNHAKPNQLKRRREVSDNSGVQKKTQDPCIRTILWDLLTLVKSWIGIMRDLRHADPTQILQIELYDDWQKALSSVLVQSALQENWWAEAMENHCFLRNVQDLVPDGKTPHERRFNSPFKWPNIPFGAEVNIFQISSQDQGRVHLFGTKVLSWNIHWIRLECGREELDKWSEELHPIPPSEMRVKRFKPKEVKTISTETMKVYSRAGLAKSCKRNNRYLPLCAKLEAPSCENLSKILQKKKKKPEMQIQISKLNKISETLWEITCIGIMLLRERNCMFRRTIFRYLWSKFVSKETNENWHCRSSWGYYQWLLECWWRQVTVWTLDRCDKIRIVNTKPPGGHMWVRGRLTKKQVTARPGNIWREERSSMPKGSERKALNKWADWTLRENNRYLLHSGRWPWFWGNHEVFGRDGI